MNETLSNKQIAFFLFSAIVGFEMIIMPNTIAKTADTAGWLVLLIGTLIAIIPTYIITRLGLIHESKTFFEYSRILVGKILTNLFAAIYIVFFFLYATMTIRIYADVIKTTILNKTPVWALSLLFLIVVYYTVTKKIMVIARLCVLYGIFTVFFAIMIRLLILPEGKMVNIRPFWGLNDIWQYTKALPVLSVFFLGMEALMLVPFNQKENKKVFKYTIFTICFIGLLYIGLYESSISITSVDHIIHHKDALLAVLVSIEVRYLGFFQRLEGLFFALWTMSVLTSVIIMNYGSVLLISKWFPRVHFNIIALVIMIASFIVTLLPTNMEQVFIFTDYLSYLSIVTAVLIPITLLIMTKVKGYGKK